MAVRVTLAGRVGIEANGTAADQGLGRLGRLALAYLVSERQRPVARDELAEVVWGDDLPSSWEQLLRGIASKIRQCLGACGLDPTSALTTTFGAYQLHLPADAAVDVEEAAAALDAAQTALETGQARRAAELAMGSLSVVSRPFLPGSSGAWVERRQAELRQLRLAALEALADAAESNRDWGEAIRAAEAAASLEPYRESAYVRLMAAHAGAGNRGEALRAYERCRRVLGDELGVNPSPQTETAYLKLLGDEPQTFPDRSPGPERTGLPLPAALAAPPASFLVGREAEIEGLTAAWDRAPIMGRQVVLIGGEPGVGKSSLVAHVARAWHGRGARVLYGRCDEEVAVPYQPFAEALGHLVATCSPAELDAHVAAYGGDLAHLLPELARRPDVPLPSPADPEADRWRLFGAVSGILAAASDVAPVVLVLDDLHWAAAPTLLLVRHVLRSLASAPVVVLGTYRDTEVAPGQPLAQTLADLRREPAVDRMSLTGLDQDAVDAFVKAAGTGSLDEDEHVLARALHAHTAGNPFFVGELLRHLAETGSVYRREGSWSYYADAEGLGVPQSVREVVERRLQRLPAASNRALLWAAVVGTTFELRLLERLTEPADTEGALDAIEATVAARLVVELAVGHYRFAHSLVRDAIYTGASATRRARLHRQVGEAIESEPGPDDVRLPALAHHFAAAATTGCATKAADYAVAAARRALGQAAWEDAVARLEVGLGALGAVEPARLQRRCELLLMVAETWTRFWDPPRAFAAAAEAVETARSLGSAELLGRATRWYVTALGAGVGGPDEQQLGVRLASEALEALGDNEPGLRATILARAAALGPRRADTAAVDDATRKALALARRSGDADALGVALHMRCRSLLGSEAPGEHRALTEELVAAAPPDGWDGWRSGHELRAIARLVDGDRVGFDEDVAAVERLGAQRRFWYYQLVGARWRGTQALLDGRFEEAERLIAEAAASPGPFAELVAIQTFKLRFEQGRLAEYVEDLAQVLADYPQNVALSSMLAFAHAAVGQGDEARREFDALMRAFPTVPRWAHPVTLAYLAELAATLGDADRSAEVYPRLRPYAGQVVASGNAVHCPGSIDRHLGQLAATVGRFADSEAHYEAAVALDANLRSPPLLARTRYWFGRMLVNRGGAGDVERAVPLLADSLATAEQLGMAALAQDVRAALPRV